ncbi:MAG: tetratricopeptide repeat protein [Archangiaceae bacterium]|nr:tetratricopeptide repeat protein [Archangiaceae bacterium]
MKLSRPIKSMLEPGSTDAPISRGWSRVQKKQRTRDTVRKSALAVCCLSLAVAVGWAVRPLFPRPAAPAVVVAAAPASVRPASARLDALVQQLPRVQGRPAQVQRPAPAPQAAATSPLPEPEVDVVAALLESVRDAYDAGNTSRAAALLSEIAEKHSDDPRAAQALYVLGLIQLDKTHEPGAAAASFTRALELGPPNELVAPLWKSLERARAAKAD